MPTPERAAAVLAVAVAAVFGQGAGSAADGPAVANTKPYDGSANAFADFVRANGKDWPLPVTIDYVSAGSTPRVRYAHWAAPDPAKRLGTVVFFQGRTEFIEKNIYAYKELLSRNYDVWTLDWRGQGFSARESEPASLRSEARGNMGSFDEYVADAEQLIGTVAKLNQHPGRKLLLAHSTGGAVGFLYLEKHPDTFDKAVFTSPLLRPANLPFYAGPYLWLMRQVGWSTRCAISSPCPWQSQFSGVPDSCHPPADLSTLDLTDVSVTDRYTHNYARLAETECLVGLSRGNADRPEGLAVGGATIGWVHAALEAEDAISAGRDRLKTPVLIVADSNDQIVDTARTRAFCASVKTCDFEEIEKSGHEILIEVARVTTNFWSHFDAFVTKP